MFYTIYKITNQIDGKFYIGSHKTINLDDNYMGSGKYLRLAQEKYGIENFTKEILFVFDTVEEMYAKEAEIVNEDFISSENTYNLKIGGFGGWDYINENIDLSERNRKINSRKDYTKLVESGFYDEFSSKGVEKIKQLLKERGGVWWESKRFSGKNHSTETKQLIGTKNSKHQIGQGNSQYGTRWIHSLEFSISKKIKKHDPLPDGWSEGRKMKF
jgi:hypothetical protein